MAFACMTQASAGSGVSGPVRGSLGPVERRVERLPLGALAACGSGGLEESLPALWRVLWVYFWGRPGLP